VRAWPKVTASEQEQIEFCTPDHLKHVIVTVSEMGLRPYKELLPMKKYHEDNQPLNLIPSGRTVRVPLLAAFVFPGNQFVPPAQSGDVSSYISAGSY
jgi:hypothetical protein